MRENKRGKMTYELIGEPRIGAQYSDEWETTMVADLRREDGETGNIWIVAGVPAYLQGTARAAGHTSGLERVRVFGDSPDMWCPDSFDHEDSDAMLDAVEDAALRRHREREDM
jgi:hypothetical protein